MGTFGSPFFWWEILQKRIFVYVDGFNFYYGCIKGSPYKWFDLVKLGNRLMAGEGNLVKVKYFTAHVKEMGDPDRPIRQQTYWRALKACYGDEVEIIKGKFRIDPKPRRKAILNSSGKYYASDETIMIMDPKEKGSDVNLCVHLVNDGWKNLYDIALVISNDSDSAEAIKITKSDCNKEIFLVNPSYRKKRHSARELRTIGIQRRNITKKLLEICQLPDPIPGTNIHKPKEWCENQ